MEWIIIFAGIAIVFGMVSLVTNQGTKDAEEKREKESKHIDVRIGTPPNVGSSVKPAPPQEVKFVYDFRSEAARRQSQIPNHTGVRTGRLSGSRGRDEPVVTNPLWLEDGPRRDWYPSACTPSSKNVEDSCSSTSHPPSHHGHSSTSHYDSSQDSCDSGGYGSGSDSSSSSFD